MSIKYDYPALTVWRANFNGDNFDPNQEWKLIEQIGTNLIKTYYKTQRVATLSPRDVYQNIFSNALPNGTIQTVLYDNPNDDPETPGVVRMNVALAGLEFIPD